LESGRVMMASRWLLQRLFFLWVTFSMIMCVVIFLPWFLPRETVCGLLGRWKDSVWRWQRALGTAGCWLFDRILHTDEEDCGTIARMEATARQVLYRRGETAGCE
jgi:hypothetical protein